MLISFLALLLLEVLLGASAHAPVPLTAATVAVIACVLLVFGVRERRAHSRAAPGGHVEITPSARRRTGPRDTDGMAVAAFVLGLLGLPFLNLVLGPFAFVLALLARHRRTTRRLPALAGMILGIADVAVYAALATADNTVVLSLA